MLRGVLLLNGKFTSRVNPVYVYAWKVDDVEKRSQTSETAHPKRVLLSRWVSEVEVRARVRRFMLLAEAAYR
jgi:uncharacterized protein YdaL